MKRVAIIFLLVCTGCSAQTVSPELKAKIQRQIQAQYDLPPGVTVDVGPRRPSDFPTYDAVTITLSGSGREQKVDFLLSQDGKTLAKVTRLDKQADSVTATIDDFEKDGPDLSLSEYLQ